MTIANACTIPEMFARRVDATPDKTALVVPSNNTWRQITWRNIAVDVNNFLIRLKDFGIQPGDRVVLLSENRYEWVVVDLAIQFAGAISIPLHSLSTAEQVSCLIAHSEPGLIVASTDQQKAKVDASVFNQPVWLLDECSTIEGSSSKLNADAVHPDSLLSIMYTSGTTGESKGVMLTQANVVSNVYGKLARLPLDENDVRWCMLPFSHIFGRTCDIYTWIAAGCTSALSRARDYWLEELSQVQPTYINSVPYFYEKLYRIVEQRGELSDDASLRSLLGGRTKICNCGGAAINNRVFDYYRSRGIGLVTGYGLTETSPVLTSSTPTQVRRGAVGIALPDIELLIANDGEVLCRGPNVMRGYYRNEQATNECFQNGWFRTGDIGHIDDDGFLFLTGRKKEMIVTTGGHNIAPIAIEADLNAHPLIEQCAVFGDGKDYLTAVLVISSLSKKEPDKETITAILRERLTHRPKYEQIGKFIVAEESFTVENRLLTPKGSLRRHEVYQRFKTQIERLYDQSVNVG